MDNNEVSSYNSKGNKKLLVIEIILLFAIIGFLAFTFKDNLFSDNKSGNNSGNTSAETDNKKDNEKKDEEIKELTGNEMQAASQIETCPNCVFAYYSKYYKYGTSDATILTEYTDDYTTLKNSEGEQRTRFLGHVLTENGQILRAYSCGISNGKAFCIRGYTDGTYYESNIAILKQVFGEDKCQLENDDIYACEDDNIRAYTYPNGYVGVSRCLVSPTGSMTCPTSD